MFDRAKTLQPQNYLPYLFGASVMPDAIGSLQEAIRLNPLSIKSLLLLGEEYAAKNDLRNALKYMDSAATLFPAYEIPYLRAAKVMNSMNQPDAAEHLIRKAAELMIN
jgi:tetratricopeptide (TPR) repeat protein